MNTVKRIMILVTIITTHIFADGFGIMAHSDHYRNDGSYVTQYNSNTIGAYYEFDLTGQTTGDISVDVGTYLNSFNRQSFFLSVNKDVEVFDFDFKVGAMLATGYKDCLIQEREPHLYHVKGKDGKDFAYQGTWMKNKAKATTYAGLLPILLLSKDFNLIEDDGVNIALRVSTTLPFSLMANEHTVVNYAFVWSW